jgi:hypothetical protein
MAVMSISAAASQGFSSRISCPQSRKIKREPGMRATICCRSNSAGSIGSMGTGQDESSRARGVQFIGESLRSAHVVGLDQSQSRSG